MHGIQYGTLWRLKIKQPETGGSKDLYVSVWRRHPEFRAPQELESCEPDSGMNYDPTVYSV